MQAQAHSKTHKKDESCDNPHEGNGREQLEYKTLSKGQQLDNTINLAMQGVDPDKKKPLKPNHCFKSVSRDNTV